MVTVILFTIWAYWINLSYRVIDPYTPQSSILTLHRVINPYTPHSYRPLHSTESSILTLHRVIDPYTPHSHRSLLHRVIDPYSLQSYWPLHSRVIDPSTSCVRTDNSVEEIYSTFPFSLYLVPFFSSEQI